jgi:hypothetical protein
MPSSRPHERDRRLALVLAMVTHELATARSRRVGRLTWSLFRQILQRVERLT